MDAWYSVTKKQEDLQDKWQKMWEMEQARQDALGEAFGGMGGG
jgi:hypothetical protein